MVCSGGGLGYTIGPPLPYDRILGWLNVLNPFGREYVPSTTTPPPPGAQLANASKVYSLLNKLIGVIQGGLERSRGNAALTARGEAFARDLAQAYQRAGQDIEWARSYLPSFSAAVFAWANEAGLSRAGGGQAFQKAVAGSSVARQVGGTIAQAAEGTLDVGSEFTAGVGKWLLPIGAGLLLVLLLRR